MEQRGKRKVGAFYIPLLHALGALLSQLCYDAFCVFHFRITII